METKRKSIENILCMVVITALILLIPFLAKWPWTLSDYIIIGSLLIGSGLIYELIARKMGNKTHRVVLGVAFLVMVLLIWAELAVGLFGTPFAGS